MSDLFRFEFSPIDTAFFSEGRPFNQDDEGLSEATSAFPPSPHVLASAVRVLVAEALGWTAADGDWMARQASGNGNVVIGTLLGDGVWGTGALRFSGVRLMRRTHEVSVLLPAPRNVIVVTDDAPNPPSTTISMAPQRLPALQGTDLFAVGPDAGDLQLFHPSEHGERPSRLLKNAHADAFLDSESYGEALEGRIKLSPSGADVEVRVDSREARVGIGLDRTRRTAADGQLYTASHVRLEASRSRTITLAIDLTLDEGDHGKILADAIASMIGKRCWAAVGGLGRGCWVSVSRPTKQATTIETGSRVRIALTSPALIESTAAAGAISRDAEFLGVAGCRVVAAAHDRPKRFGAWSSGSKGSARDRWLWMLPAGSVWDVECEDDDRASDLLDRIKNRGANVLADEAASASARRVGFGEVFIISIQGEATT